MSRSFHDYDKEDEKYCESEKKIGPWTIFCGKNSRGGGFWTQCRVEISTIVILLNGINHGSSVICDGGDGFEIDEILCESKFFDDGIDGSEDLSIVFCLSNFVAPVIVEYRLDIHSVDCILACSIMVTGKERRFCIYFDRISINTKGVHSGKIIAINCESNI